MPDTSWIKKRVSDELGLVEDDLLRLYSVERDQLDDHLTGLGTDEAAAVEHIFTDLDSVRTSYRTLRIDQEELEIIHNVLIACRYTPLIPVETALGGRGWHFNSDDAQWIAYRVADKLEMSFEASDLLRVRLNRLVIWNSDDAPTFDDAFRERVAQMTAYLAELSTVL